MFAEEANMKKAVEISATGGDAAWRATSIPEELESTNY